MAQEEISQKYFTRERVRNRILKRAAELWGYSESEIEDFDPLVTLLIDATSVEFEKIAGEIAKSQNRMLERIAQLLYPGTTTVHPAYGILQARSAEPVSILPKETQFVIRPSQTDRKRDVPDTELFFSPSRQTKIVDGVVRFIASAREIFLIEEAAKKTSIAFANQKNIQFQHSLWLGLDIHEDVTSLQDVSFFFNWINQPESKRLFQYLQTSKWSVSSRDIKYDAGFGNQIENQNDAGKILEREFDSAQTIEKTVNELFEEYFITIRHNPDIDFTRVNRELYPQEFESLFNKADLKSFDQELLWLEIIFPPELPFEALDSIWCAINSFPVINRKLNTFSYKLLSTLNIVPLETDGFFVSIREISNSHGNSTKLIPFVNSGNLTADTYTLRYGVNRFDDRDARDTLTSLVELLKEESSFFSSLGEEFLIQNIRELNQILARLEERVKGRNRHHSPYPFLIIKPIKEGVNVKIEFWSCNGELANKIPIGSKLHPYRTSTIRDGSIFLLTSTTGARDRFGDTEIIDYYKTALLTRGRIVTIEDLRTFLKKEMGTLTKKIECKKTYIASSKPGGGFILCMEIKVTPKDAKIDISDWEQRLRGLELKLKSQSANNIPFRIVLDK